MNTTVAAKRRADKDLPITFLRSRGYLRGDPISPPPHHCHADV